MVDLGHIRVGAVAMRGSLFGDRRVARPRLQQRHARRRGQHPLDCRASINHSSFLFIFSAMRSAARQATAMMVSVGFLSAFEANTAPSVTNRFFTSQVWHQPLVTEVRRSAPMIAPPTS